MACIKIAGKVIPMIKHQINPKAPPFLPKTPRAFGPKMLKSNMCQLTAVLTSIYQYSFAIAPKVEDSLAHLRRSIVKGCSEVLTNTLGDYVHSGGSLYSFNKASNFHVTSRAVDSELRANYEIEVALSREVPLKDAGKLSAEQAQELEMVLNIYLRKAVEALRLFPLKNNRYFNLAQASAIAGTNLMSVTGYFLSVAAVKEGLYLTIDTITEFFRSKNCLEEIREMKTHGFSDKRMCDFFKGKRVSLCVTKGKTWRISAVNFELTPIKAIVKPEETPLIKYWEEKYKVRVTELAQPLFKAKKNGEAVFLIPEFCHLTGVEEESKRFGKNMADLATAGGEPQEKDRLIGNMFRVLGNGRMLERYGLVMSERTKLPLQVLSKPVLRLGEGEVLSPDMLSKGVRIMNPINFINWLFIYERKNYTSAEQLCVTMQKASGALGVVVKDPEWAELNYIDSYSVENAIMKHSADYQFILVLISDRHKQYKSVKKILDIQQGIVSQCVYSDYKKMNSLVFSSNIIRQLNAKMGGDLYSVELPAEVPRNTMFVGIDVCHCARCSAVGFYSNAYTHLARCFCDTALQKRGQEVVTLLAPFYASAFYTYLKQQGKLPDYIFIYRDGVGRSQRNIIVEKELSQLKKVVSNLRAGYKPEITMVIVNKRIHQRFLQEIGPRVDNPEPGTIIDTKVTENGCDNFFMVSAIARKGTIRPTHFYIAHNERKVVTKLVIQKVSYAMSFMYYNTPWSLKVPAQIALADKKAYYVSTIEGQSNKKLACTESFL
eukprot:TRINITY_DN4074_c0_g6_i1.p1 TRINITY_DN4074_c0_g6~~TRINITY_DN4074_c0_g6_i1.p1  ORF type:complete len:773 (-),score=231.86 TRINITY_DN4074_c0_g6_i1:92-2410(-)